MIPLNGSVEAALEVPVELAVEDALELPGNERISRSWLTNVSASEGAREGRRSVVVRSCSDEIDVLVG
jgi:hypothetical protein